MNAQPESAAAPYLPHEFDAVLLDSVWAVDAQTTRASAQVRPGTPFSDQQGGWPAWLAVELMAQAVAAGVGLREFSPGTRPKLGLLLGVRALECTERSFAQGSVLTLQAVESTRDERGMGVFDCRIESGGACRASATLSVYLPQNVDDYLRSLDP